MAQPLTDARFVTSAADARKLGVCHAEVAFVGRSNVGKSSLLNALANQKQLAYHKPEQLSGKTVAVVGGGPARPHPAHQRVPHGAGSLDRGSAGLRLRHRSCR